MQVISCVFILVISITVAHGFLRWPSSNTGDGRHLCLNTRNRMNGLAFPMTSGRDYGQLIPHGPHCMEEIEGFTSMPPTNDMDKMHNDHCLCLAHRMVKYLSNMSHYHLPGVVCEPIRELYVSPLGEVYAYFDYPLGYGAAAYGNDTIVTEEAAITDSRRSYESLAKMAHQDDRFSKEVFDLVSGQNLGELLVRDWRDGRHTLNSEEAVWVAQWDEMIVAQLAIQGVTCIGINEGGEHMHHGVDNNGGASMTRAGIPIVAHNMYHPPIDRLNAIINNARFFKPSTCPTAFNN